LKGLGESLAALMSKFAQIKSNGFLRSVGILSSGSAFGHLFTLAAAPILTRVYGPKDFGALGLFTDFLGIVGVAVSLQYEISIVAGRDETEAAYLTFGAIMFTLPVSILAGLLLWMLIYFSALGFGVLPGYTPFLMAFTMVFIGLFTALRYWSLREKQFGQIAQGLVVQSGGRAILQTALGFAGLHASGMLLGESIGRCLGMSRMLRSAWPVLREHARSFRSQDLLSVLWNNRKFPLYSMPSSFLNALCLGLSLPLLIRQYGVATGGQYSLVWKAITVPSVLITVAVADTFHSHLAVCARDTPDQIMKLFRTTTVSLLLLGIGPAMILWFFGPPLFAWVFGAQWRLSGTMAALVAPWYLAQFVVSPLSRVVVVLSGQELKLVWDVFCLLALLGVFYTAHVQSFSPLKTIGILSAMYTTLMFLYYLVLLRIIARYTHIPCAEAPAV
jgi:O-antigen/teichoic acid export membrane protein